MRFDQPMAFCGLSEYGFYAFLLIELISERGMEDAFENKHAAVMTTSIHYYDHHAHNYMRAVCEDISMKFVDAISLDIIDMMEEERRREMIVFAEGFFIDNYEIFVKKSNNK